MNNCAESQTRVCKAYVADCYSHLANSYNTCKSAERHILKKNIFDMLDRVKSLLDNEKVKEDNDAENEIENNSDEESD